MTVSPPPSAGSPRVLDWLEVETLAFASFVAPALADALLAGVRALRPRVLVAGADEAGGFAAFDSAWQAFLEGSALNLVADVYSAGKSSALSAAQARAGFAFAPPVVNEHAVAYLAAASNRLVRVSDDIWTGTVRPRLTDLLAAGTSIDDIQRELIAAVPSFSDIRAETIARTETVGAYNGGTDGMFRALDPAFSPTVKAWLATGDARTRPEHLAADGQEVPLDAPFIVGGEALYYPGDPLGSAANVINCRCTLLHYFAGEALPSGGTA